MSARVTNQLAAAAWPSAVGESIEGRYLLEERVDVDGPCAVYRARDASDQLVAVQVLHDASTGAKFQRAAETLAALAHPNIAGIRETGVWGQGGYIVLEWLEGESLASRLRGGPLKLEVGLSIARQLLAALASVHAAGLVHGALSPSHVFLQRRKHGERVKVQHFRLLASNGTRRAAVSGVSTQAEVADGYRAPELASGLVDARSDVFALGVMLSEIALAIAGSSADAAARSVELTEAARDEAERAAVVGAAIQDLTRRATAERPADRFSDAAELLCELIDALPRGAGASSSFASSASPTSRVTVVAAPSPAAAAAARDAKLAASKLAQAPSPFAVGARAEPYTAPWKTRGVHRLPGAASSSSGVNAPAAPSAGVSNSSLIGANALSVVAATPFGVDAPGVPNAYPAVAVDSTSVVLRSSLPNAFDTFALAPIGADTSDAFLARRTTRSPRLFGEFAASLRGVFPSQRVVQLFHTQLSAALVGALVAAGALTWLMRSDASVPRASASPKPKSGLVRALPEPEVPQPDAPIAASAQPETAYHAAIAAIAVESDAAPARAAPVSPARPPRAAHGMSARNPWLDPVPAELQGIPAYVASGGKGHEAMTRALRDYIGAQPHDPRPHLLLGGLYFNRLWRADCVSEWTLALRRDPSVRAAPQLLSSLIQLVIQGKDAPAAADLIVNYYGGEALDAIEDAIPPLRNSQAAARLQSVHARLLAEN
jgi:hypothetical protein